MFTPAGIILGLFFTSNKVVEAVFLAISTGTFLYVACSEVIVEEFAMSRYKYQKFILFMVGGILIGSLSLLEALEDNDS
jgi:zinc transporter 1/2/3